MSYLGYTVVRMCSVSNRLMLITETALMKFPEKEKANFNPDVPDELDGFEAWLKIFEFRYRFTALFLL